jgi:hypothetical protein
MPIGSRSRKNGSRVSAARKQAAVNYVAGVTEAAFLAAMSDGELSEAEYDQLVSLVSGLFDGDITQDSVDEILEACEEAFESDGFEARMDHIAEKLPNAESRYLALYAVAAVVLGDDEYDEENEGAFYDDFAEKVGADEETAAEIWNEQLEAYGWS